MNEAHADSSAPGLAGSKPQSEGRGKGWSRRRWLTLVALVFAAEAAFVFALGEKKFPPPRPVTNVPRLALADSSSELIALEDPTLFALPRAGDLVPAVWGQPPVMPQSSFPRTEPSLPPLLATENLGGTFIQFMRTNVFVPRTNHFKPRPKLSGPALTLPPAFADNSSLRIEGELAQRRLLAPVDLPSLPYPDVISPSKVQALVDEAGSVVNAILLPPDSAVEIAGHPDVGDTNALRIALMLRFAPSSRLTVGQLIFNWRTVPPPATNSPAAAP